MPAPLYLLFLLVVGAERIAELVISKRHQREMTDQGVEKVAERHFGWMVAVHTGVLIAAYVEVALLHRPFVPAIALAMGLVFLVATGLRIWVIRTMRTHWNVEVMASAPLGVVTEGPYRFIRHPNYLAVVLELVAIPMLHGAWLTAIAGSLANAWVLMKRLEVEERVLLSDERYRSAMGPKARFVPGLF
jgi:methyltransferase